MGKLYSYGAHSYGSGIAKIAAQRFDRLLLSTILAPAAYAQYSLAVSIRDLAVLPSTLHAQTLKNRQVDLLATLRDTRGARRLLLQVGGGWFTICLVASSALFPWWSEIVSFLFGAGHADTATFLGILAFSSAPLSFYGIALNHLYGRCRPGLVTVLAVASLVAAWPVYWLMVQLAGPNIGAALAALSVATLTSCASLAVALLAKDGRVTA
jgi:O-antigen/teichoic acid export membrane protein